MPDIELSNHFLILLCIAGAIFIFSVWKLINGKRKLLWISLFISSLWYVLMVGGVLYEEVYYQREYNECLDQYGLYTKRTSDCDEAMENLISDTGRVFAPIIGFITSAILFVFVYLLGLVISPVIKAIKCQK